MRIPHHWAIRRAVWLVLIVVVLTGCAAGRTAPAPVVTPTVPALIAAVPAPSAAPHATTTAATTAAPPVDTVVRLRPGDTLWALARRYGTTVAALQARNGLGGSTLIYAGTDLRVPATRAVGTLTTHRAAGKSSAAMPRAGGGSGSVRQDAAAVFGSQYACAANIITRESGWNVSATNPVSGAYGLAQALPGKKMAVAGPDWRTDPTTQLRWMRTYVDARYGGACGAWAFWQAHAWY